MERELWPRLYHILQQVACDVHQKHAKCHAWVIAAVLLWAALHDRSIQWACQKRHWSSTQCKPASLPHPSNVSRRSKRVSFGLFLNLLSERLRGSGLPGLVVVLDGKPLLVGGCSHDPDAEFGRAAGHVGRGYKLHAAWSGRAMPEAWEVTSLRVHEIHPAARLLRQLPGGYALADANYDATALYDAAAAGGYQLLAEQLDNNPGSGHHYQSPYRLRCIALLQTPFGRALFARRRAIERYFGHASYFGGGLGAGLPPWVRRSWRVERWVWAKLAINAVRVHAHQPLTPRLQ
jgi:hypothetical protein